MQLKQQFLMIRTGDTIIIGYKLFCIVMINVCEKLRIEGGDWRERILGLLSYYHNILEKTF